jgi:nitroimidazol reductase NimA-like FMN-containing flavoprotein (pyridoxamine 5'-phosphate oxidase superfamily)
MRRSDREVSEIEVIEEIIKKADVCRIALAYDNIPYIVTMIFGYTNDPEQKLFFHCANEGRKLEMIRKNKFVCFEMDIDHQIYTRPGKDGRKGCNWGMKYRSVVGYGNISVITETEARKTGLDFIMRHYGDKNEYVYDEKVLANTTILKLDITEMTGKKR